MKDMQPISIFTSHKATQAEMLTVEVLPKKLDEEVAADMVAGFAGGTADAFTLFELFEGKLEQYGNLTRAVS